MKQLEIFVMVAKHLSFSKAAEEMFLSQPTVSNGVSALEKLLGVQLLVRNTKEVSLTKNGRDFFVYAKKILSLREQAVRSVGSENREARSAIDIIASTVPAQHLLPEIIMSFKKTWRNTVFRVNQADSGQALSEMTGFRYDFGMVGSAPGSDRFVSYPVYDDELVLAVPNNLANPEAIRANFTDFIKNAPFIMREPGSGTRAEIETLFMKIGVNPADLNVPAYFPDAHGVLLSVSLGMGVSLVPKVAAVVYAETGLITVIEMRDPLFRRQIYLVHNRELELTSVQLAFAEHVRVFYRQRNG